MISKEELAERLLAKKFKDLELYAPLVGVEDGEFTYVVSTSNYSGGLKLFQRKEHLASQIPVILDWCEDHIEPWPDSSKLLLNVGAHIGAAVIPIIGGGYFSSAIAFEPEPLNAKLLRANLALNGIEQDVTVYEMALSNQNATVSMYLSEYNHGQHAIFDRELASKTIRFRRKEPNWPEIKVECQSFDHFVESHVIEIDEIGFAFIDIEGSEGHFLDGAQRLLQQKVPMVIELMPYFLERNGGLDLFANNALEHFSRFVDCSYPGDVEFKIQGIGGLSALVYYGKPYNLILIP